MKLTLGVILASLSFAVAAQSGYVVSSDGRAVRDSQGQCVRTDTWTKDSKFAECDPPKVVQAPVTVVVPDKPYIAPLPAPQPTTKAVTNKVVVQADLLFSFDKADLTTNGKAELDKIAGSVKEGTKVVVVGHADPIGNAEYNQKLSERRAKAVADYLATKVKAEYAVSGVGSTKPAKDTEKCKAIKNWKEKVRCYAPDRRVEVEYTAK